MSEVDDLIYTGDEKLVSEFEAGLKAKWNISQSEELNSFLGINIHYDKVNHSIKFDVTEKIKKIFEERPWLCDAGFNNLPMNHSPKKASTNCKSIEAYHDIATRLLDAKTYASVVGACIYTSMHLCRPDITQTAGRV